MPNINTVDFDAEEFNASFLNALKMPNSDDVAKLVTNSRAFLEQQAPPTGFSAFPLSVISEKVGTQYSCNIAASDVIDFQNDFDRYMYANVDAPNSSGDGLTYANAKKSAGSCIDAAIAAGISSIIIVKAADLTRFNGFMNVGTMKTLTCNIAVMAVGGRVTTGPFETLNWTQNTTYPSVYQTNRSNAQQVMNPQLRNSDGSDFRYEAVSSIALCAATPNTWYTDNSITYVHTANDAPANDANARVFLSARNLSVTGGGLYKLYLYGIDFVGGTTGALDCTDTIVVAESCTFRYAVGNTYSAGWIARDGVAAKGGLFVGIDCDSSFNSKDGFNFHSSALSDGNSLTINCSASKNGHIIPNTGSCNGLTNHDGGKSIDIGGVYLGSLGANVAIVNDDTEMWCYGTRAGNSFGDFGSITTGGFSTGGGNAKLFLENTTDVGAKVGINNGSGEIVIRNHKGSGQRVGTITELIRA